MTVGKIGKISLPAAIGISLFPRVLNSDTKGMTIVLAVPTNIKYTTHIMQIIAPTKQQYW